METENTTTSESLALNAQKLEEARQAISEFFHATDMDYMRVELWQLLKSVTTEKPFSFLGDPSTVLCLKRHLHKIITACRLLLDVAEEEGNDLIAVGFQPFSQEQIEADKERMRDLRELIDRYGGEIRRLSLAETERPILAIKRVFNVYSYDEWQEILEDWAEYGLSKVSICEATGECAEVIQYELLESLLEAIYLISRQDEGIPFQKRRLWKAAGSKAIIELLIAALQPELIFEVTHRVPSPTLQTHYRDLLIVLPDNNHKPFKEIEPLIELITAGDEKLCCSVRKFSDLHQALEGGHLYFSLVCTAENLIYQAKVGVLPTTSSEKISRLIENPKKDFTVGLAKAKKFFDGASYYREIKEYPLCMFMLQQATETTFRTVAISLYGIERRTHSIRSLKEFNRRLAPQLNDVFPDNTPQEEKLLTLLEDAYLGARYASSYQIGSADLETIFVRVSRLPDLAELTFRERMSVVSGLGGD